MMLYQDPGLVGKWVHFKAIANEEKIGYVESVNAWEQATIIAGGTKYHKSTSWLTVAQTELTDEDKADLIDLTLWLKDKKWFENLTRKKVVE